MYKTTSHTLDRLIAQYVVQTVSWRNRSNANVNFFFTCCTCSYIIYACRKIIPFIAFRKVWMHSAAPGWPTVIFVFVNRLTLWWRSLTMKRRKFGRYVCLLYWFVVFSKKYCLTASICYFSTLGFIRFLLMIFCFDLDQHSYIWFLYSLLLVIMFLKFFN